MICALRPKKGGIYLSSSNPDNWSSPQRTHKVECAYRFWWTNHGPKQLTDKIELPYTQNLYCLPFLEANSNLMTKFLNFDIAFLKAMTDKVFLRPSLGGGGRLKKTILWGFFLARKSILGLTGWSSSHALYIYLLHIFDRPSLAGLSYKQPRD